MGHDAVMIVKDSCTRCDPSIQFSDRVAHKKHMQMIHGSCVYFKDLERPLRVKSVESLAKFMQCVVSDDSLLPMQDCECESVEPYQPHQMMLALALHDLIADHKPVQKCIQCGIVIFEELLLIHL